MTDSELNEIGQRYERPFDGRFTTATINALWEQCRHDVAVLLAEVDRLKGLESPEPLDPFEVFQIWAAERWAIAAYQQER